LEKKKGGLTGSRSWETRVSRYHKKSVACKKAVERVPWERKKEKRRTKETKKKAKKEPSRTPTNHHLGRRQAATTVIRTPTFLNPWGGKGGQAGENGVGGVGGGRKDKNAVDVWPAQSIHAPRMCGGKAPARLGGSKEKTAPVREMTGCLVPAKGGLKIGTA